MATLLSWFRGRRRLTQTAFMLGATVKLAPYLVQSAHAQQTQAVNVREIGGVSAVSMPFICDNSTGILSTAIVISSTQAGILSSAAPGSSKAIFVCGYQVTNGDSTGTWKFVTGTSSECVTGQADLSGAFNASSKWGISVPNGGAPQFRVSSGQALCIEASNSTLGGMLTYALST